MAGYEYGNLYVLTVTYYGLNFNFSDDPPTADSPGYLVEVQGHKTVETIWNHGGTLLEIMNRLGRQGWVIHSEVLVNAPAPTWMEDLMRPTVLGLTGARHQATHLMSRRLPVLGRKRTTSAERLGGVSLTPVP